MKADEKRVVAAAMRRFVILTAERRALFSILDSYVDLQKPPNGWREDLERLRQTPQYRAILEEHEPMIRQLEQDAELDDLIPILEKMNKDKPPN